MAFQAHVEVQTMTSSSPLIAVTAKSRPLDLLADPQVQGADYVVVENQADSNACDVIRAAIRQDSPDIVVVYDANCRAWWQDLRDIMPLAQYLMTALPCDDLAMAVSVKAVIGRRDLVESSQSMCELIVRMAEQRSVALVPGNGKTSSEAIPTPDLKTPDRGPRFPWLRSMIYRVSLPGKGAAARELVAIQAGLFLLNDFFDESHSRSQSIEGLGPDHTGDYWHAILHRREPDYGNSKYWFRHVGRHPVFPELADAALRQLAAASGVQSRKLDSWRQKLISNGRWDPFAFVDLCAVADNDPDLKQWCEDLQLEEMLLLLKASYQAALQ